ncbi:hypothetical protein Rhal01_01893 [Rubritalea halochordaticola]|uniref:RNA polymerase sigma-70 region 2 domain-containing protein n=1 Tax=Rubritalea halochordaticola TaxID=714537 RepID=A0ABP9V1C7_9BACT
MNQDSTHLSEPNGDDTKSPFSPNSEVSTHPALWQAAQSEAALDSLGPKHAEVKQFTQLYLAAQPSLRAFLSTIVRDPAAVEDCLQETCIVLWKKRDPSWDIEDFRRLAFTCARFKGLSWLKKNKPNLKTYLSPDITKKLSMKVAEHEQRNANRLTTRLDAMRHCLDLLSDKQREIIQARYESDQADALAKIASRMNRSMDAIYKQLERIRTSLRKCIQNQLSS